MARIAIPSYLKNLGRSLGYGMKDAFKEYNPVITNLVKETKEAKDDLFSSISDFKSDFTVSDERTLMGELKESGKDIIKNLFDDIKSGNIYNKERQEDAENMALAAMGFDMSDFDIDMDDWGDDDWTADDSAKAEVAQSVKNTQATVKAMDIVGGKVSKAVASSNARTAQHIANVTREGNRALYSLNQRGFNSVSRQLLSINESIVGLAKIGEPMTQHFNNATVFFTKTTETLNKIEGHLATIASATAVKTAADANAARNSRNTGFNDIFSSDLGISPRAYLDMVKANFGNDKFVIDMVTDGIKNIKNAKKGNSYGSSISVGVWMTQYITRAMIPKIMKDSMMSLNESLRDFMGAGLLRLRDKSSGNFIVDLLKDYFVPKDNYSGRDRIDTGKYARGKVAWDGESRQALTHVIPEYLSMIYGELSGNNIVYNYDTGKFVQRKSIRNEMIQNKTSRARTAGGDFREMLLKTLKKNNSNLSQADLEKMTDEFFVRSIFGDSNQRRSYNNIVAGRGTGADRTNLGIDVDTLKAIEETLKEIRNISRTPGHANRQRGRAVNAFEIARAGARDDWAQYLRDAEMAGNSPLAYLYNGVSTASGANKKAGGASGIMGTIVGAVNNIEDSLLNIIPSYLQVMLQTMEQGKFRYYDKKARRWYTADRMRDNNRKNIKGMQSVRQLTRDRRRSRENAAKENKQGSRTTSGTQSDAAAAAGGAGDATGGNIYGDDLFNDSGVFDESGVPQVVGEDQEVRGMKKLWKKITNWLGGIKGKWISADPSKFGGFVGSLANMMNAVSYSINTLFMGGHEPGEQGLMGVLTGEIKNAFSGLTKFYEDHMKEHVDKIGKFIKEKLFQNESLKEFWEGTKGKLKQWGSNAKDYLGRKFYGGEKNYRNWKARHSMQKAANAYGIDTSSIAFDAETDDIGAVLRDYADESGFYAGGTYYRPRRLRRYANGARMVPKTGLAVLSEGELVIPSEFNPFYHKYTDKGLQMDREARVEKRYFGKHATGTGSAGADPKKAKEGFLGLIMEGFGQFSEGGKSFFEKTFDPKSKNNKKMADAMKKVADTAFGGTSEQKKDNMHAMGAGAIIGTGASILTGAVVGPLFGAAIGAGVGLIVNSEKVQKTLFGEDVVNEETGEVEKTGGVLGKKISTFLTKNLPSVGKGAGIGAAAGLFLGSPIIGAIVGGTIGYVKSSEKAKVALFGEKDQNGNRLGGLIPVEIQNKIKKGLPKAAAGAVLGLVAGPFGSLTANLILGSALGFATETEAFKQKVFGKDDNDDKSLVNIVKNKIIGNVDELGHNVWNALKGWGKKFFGNLGDKIKAGVKKLMDNAKNGKGGFFTKLFGGALNLGDKLIKTPLNAIGNVLGGLSRAQTTHNLNAGYNVYDKTLKRNLTARERNIMREQRNSKTFEFDNLLAKISDKSDLEELMSGLDSKELSNDEKKALLDKFQNKTGVNLNLKDKLGTGDLSQFKDLIKTELETRDWEKENAEEAKDYHKSMRNWMQLLIDKVVYGKTPAGISDEGKETTGKLREGIREGTIDADGTRHFYDEDDNEVSMEDAFEQRTVHSSAFSHGVYTQNPNNLNDMTGGIAGKAFDTDRYHGWSGVKSAFGDLGKGIGNFAKQGYAGLKKKLTGVETIWKNRNVNPNLVWSAQERENALAKLEGRPPRIITEENPDDFINNEEPIPMGSLGGTFIPYYGRFAEGGFNFGSVLQSAGNFLGKVGNGIASGISSLWNTLGSGKVSRGADSIKEGNMAKVDYSAGSGGGSMGGAFGGSSDVNDPNNNGTKTVFDSFARPHQFTVSKDGEYKESTNDSETDASRSAMDGMSGSIGSVPIATSILANIQNLLMGMSYGGAFGEAGIAAAQNVDNNNAMGVGMGMGGLGLLGGAAAIGSGLLNLGKKAVRAGAGVLSTTVGSTAATAAIAAGAADNPFAKATKKLGLTSSNGESIFRQGAAMMGDYQLQTDASGKNVQIDEETGFYKTTSGNYIDPDSGTVYDSYGNAVDQTTTKVSRLGGNHTLSGEMAANFGRTAAKTVSNAAVGDSISSLFKKSVKDSAYGVTQKGIQKGARGLGTLMDAGSALSKKVANSKAGKAVDKFLSKSRGPIGRMYQGSKLGKKVTDAGVSVLGKAAKTIANFLGDCLEKFSSLPLVRKFIGSKVGTYIKDIKDGICKKLDDVLTKAAEKASAKITEQSLKELAKLAKFIDVLIYVADFCRGWGNAPSNLGIVTNIHAIPAAWKFGTACWEVITEDLISEANLVIGTLVSLIPDEFWGDCLAFVLGLIDPDCDLLRLREEALQVVAEYNKENNTNLSVSEYNHMMGNYSSVDKMGEQYIDDIGTAASDVVNTFKKEGAWEGLKTMGGAGVEALKDVGSSIRNKGILSTAIQGGAQLFTDSFLGQLGKGVNSAVDYGVENGNVVAKAYDDFMTDVVGGGFVALEDAGKWAWDGISGAADSVWNWISGKGSGIGQKPAGKGSGSGTFISQYSPKYSSMKLGNSNVEDAGCAPAVASMLMNDFGKKGYTMDKAVREAEEFQQGDNGTTIDYFDKVLNGNGVSSDILNGPKNILNNLAVGNKVVMLGQDPYNNNKEVSPWGPNPHYVLATGLTEKGEIMVKDPENDREKKYSAGILTGNLASIGAAKPTGNAAGHISRLAKGASGINRAKGDSNRFSTKAKQFSEKLLDRAANSKIGKFIGSFFGRGNAPDMPAGYQAEGLQGNGWTGDYSAQDWAFFKKHWPDLSDLQIAVIVGCFMTEGGGASARFETDYLYGANYRDWVCNHLLYMDGASIDAWSTYVMKPKYGSTSLAWDAYIAERGPNGEAYHWPGIGLMGWTGGRAKALRDFADRKGTKWYDLETQLEFCIQETGNINAKNKLKNCNTITEGIKVWGGLTNHPNCANENSDMHKLKAAAAMDIYNRYSGKTLSDAQFGSAKLTGSEGSEGGNGDYTTRDSVNSNSAKRSATAAAGGLGLSEMLSKIIHPEGEDENGNRDWLGMIGDVFTTAFGWALGKRGGEDEETSSGNAKAQEGVDYILDEQGRQVWIDSSGNPTGYYDSTGNWVSTATGNSLAGASIAGAFVEKLRSYMGYQGRNTPGVDLEAINPPDGTGGYTKEKGKKGAYTKFGTLFGNPAHWCGYFPDYNLWDMAQFKSEYYNQLMHRVNSQDPAIQEADFNDTNAWGIHGRQTIGGPHSVTFARKNGQLLYEPQLGDIVLNANGSYTNPDEWNGFHVQTVSGTSPMSIIGGNQGPKAGGCVSEYNVNWTHAKDVADGKQGPIGFFRPNWDALLPLYPQFKKKEMTNYKAGDFVVNPDEVYVPDNYVPQPGSMPYSDYVKYKKAFINSNIDKIDPKGIQVVNVSRIPDVPGMPSNVKAQWLQGLIDSNGSFGDHVRRNWPQAIAQVDPDATAATTGIPQEIFTEEKRSAKERGNMSYIRWALQNFSNDSKVVSYPYEKTATKANIYDEPDAATIEANREAINVKTGTTLPNIETDKSYWNGGAYDPGYTPITDLGSSNVAGAGIISGMGSGIGRKRKRAGKGSGMYRSKASRALHNWNKPNYKADVSGSLSKVYVGKGSGAAGATDVTIRPTLKSTSIRPTVLNTTNITPQADYGKALAIIATYLKAIVDNTGTQGMLDSNILEVLKAYLPNAGAMSQEQLKALVQTATAAGIAGGSAAARNQKVNVTGPINNGLVYVTGDLDTVANGFV